MSLPSNTNLSEHEYLRYVQSLEKKAQQQLAALLDNAEDAAYLDVVNDLSTHIQNTSDAMQVATEQHSLDALRDAANQWYNWQSYIKQLQALTQQEQRLNGVIDRVLCLPKMDMQHPLLKRLQQEQVSITQTVIAAANIEYLNNWWKLHDIAKAWQQHVSYLQWLLPLLGVMNEYEQQRQSLIERGFPFEAKAIAWQLEQTQVAVNTFLDKVKATPEQSDGHKRQLKTDLHIIYGKSMDGLRSQSLDINKREIGQHYRQQLSHHRHEVWDAVGWMESMLNAALSLTVVVPVVSQLLGVSMQVSLKPRTHSMKQADTVLHQSLALTNNFRS